MGQRPGECPLIYSEGKLWQPTEEWEAQQGPRKEAMWLEGPRVLVGAVGTQLRPVAQGTPEAAAQQG